MQKQKNILIIVVLILAVAGSLYLIVKSESAKIATFEECVKADWLVRSIKVYVGFGSIEAECTLWSGKNFIKQRSEASQQMEQPLNIAQNNWETKINDQPPVNIKITPVELGMSKGVQAWKFDVAFDTHSGSLDQDPVQVAILIDDKGNIYKPTGWEGPGPGGHHREEILVFDPINPFPQSVELKIKDIGGIPERSFKWNIQ